MRGCVFRDATLYSKKSINVKNEEHTILVHINEAITFAIISFHSGGEIEIIHNNIPNWSQWRLSSLLDLFLFMIPHNLISEFVCNFQLDDFNVADS